MNKSLYTHIYILQNLYSFIQILRAIKFYHPVIWSNFIE
jgi:hypothetical protein